MNQFLNKIICGEASQVMMSMPKESVDLIITSPPYDNLREYDGYIFDLDAIIKGIWHVLKQGGVCVWIVADQTKDGKRSLTSFRQAIRFDDLGFNVLDAMIYQKDSCPFPTPNKYYNCYENMFVITKGKHKTFNPIEDRLNSQGGVKMSHHRERDKKTGEMKKRKPSNEFVKEKGVRFNIWKYSAGGSKSSTDGFGDKHPAAMPEKLARDNIISWSNPDDVVLDIFSGGGTTSKMAMLFDRNYIGIDISQKYCELARQRIDEASRQSRLDINSPKV